MKILIAPTEDFIKLERTKLDADVSAGSDVAVTVQDNDHLVENDYVVIGSEGSEQTELVQINATVVAGQAIRVDVLKFAHKAGAQVTKYRYNKRKFYGSLTADGSFAELASYGSPAIIQVDDPQGTLLEYTGTEGYIYFRSTYYNSELDEETTVEDSETVLADESKRYTSLYAIRVQAGLTNNPFINDGRVERKRKQAENEIDSAIFSRYVIPLEEVPPLIQYICELLAAGYIDYEEYGPEGQGVKWLGEARALLKSIKKGTQRLIGADSTEIAIVSNTNILQGYPDNDGVGDPDTPERSFTVNKVY